MAFFLITAFWLAYDAIIPLILTNHFGLPQTASGVIMSIDNILAVFMLPIFGAISDKVCTRLGKRTPFILFGTIAAIATFIFLAVVDLWQFNTLVESGIHQRYIDAQAMLDSAKEALKSAEAAGNAQLVSTLSDQIKSLNESIEAIRGDVLQMTLDNASLLIVFIVTLLVVLIAMATFRSPAVALMPDITVKPLRSKANAIINLTGTAGAISVLALGILFGTSDNTSMHYLGYVFAVSALMAIGLIVFMLTVKENKWAKEMEDESLRLGIEEASEAAENGERRRLSKPEFISLILILTSVAFWYIGYNSVTSKYSVYATNYLGFDFNITMIIAQVAAVIAYIPVGIVSTKVGRKRSILVGVALLAVSFFAANFITSSSPEFIMYILFVIAGIGWATINVNSFPMVVELAHGGDVGRYTGFYYTASMAAQIVAPVLSGILYDAVGMENCFFAFGTVFISFAFVTMLFVKHGDSKPEGKKSLLENLDVED